MHVYYYLFFTQVDPPKQTNNYKFVSTEFLKDIFFCRFLPVEKRNPTCSVTSLQAHVLF